MLPTAGQTGTQCYHSGKPTQHLDRYGRSTMAAHNLTVNLAETVGNIRDMNFIINYKRLQGQSVCLEPLRQDHAEGLFIIGQCPKDWRYLPVAGFRVISDAELWVAEALTLLEQKSHYTYVLVDPDSGNLLGSSRYLNVRSRDAVLEIGYSWLGPAYQRSAVNTEAKYLLLKNAFEAMGAKRVEFKTDLRNTRSQAAIERIGAVKEGVLRNHMTTQYGYQRDSVMYSVIDRDWPAAREHLLHKMQSYNRPENG